MTSRPRIAVITTTRAEWHLLQPVVAALNRKSTVETIVLAGGSHLLAAHGGTIKHVEESAGCRVVRVDFLGEIQDLTSSHHTTAILTGQAVTAFANALSAEAADVAVVLGDRFEIMGAALAAATLGLPLVHIEGGHVTEGALDERYRHAITKLADLHFVALPVHAQRLAAMGESGERIVCTGAIGAALAHRAKALTGAEMEALTGFDSSRRPVFIATLHPETATGMTPRDMVAIFVNGIEIAIGRSSPTPAFVLTKSNLDPGGEEINAGLRSFADESAGNVRMIDTIGKDYLRAVKASAGVIGNSSSGILESSAIGVATLNIGDRQKGRDRYGPVTDCKWSKHEIASGIADMCKAWGSVPPTKANEETEQPWEIIADKISTMRTQRYQGKTFVERSA